MRTHYRVRLDHRSAPTMMRALALLLATGCAVHAAPLPPDHPASTGAPIGRIADPPATLRPGVAAYDQAPAEPAEPTEPAKPAEPAHHQHHH